MYTNYFQTLACKCLSNFVQYYIDLPLSHVQKFRFNGRKKREGFGADPTPTWLKKYESGKDY